MKEIIETISVQKGNAQDFNRLTVPKVVADRMGLKQNQYLDDKQAWEVLGESISHSLLMVEYKIEQDKGVKKN